MQYAILCYSQEAMVTGLSKAEDDAMMATIGKAKASLHAEGKLGVALRLMPTSASVTLRHGAQDLVLDGPFAETKEQLLGFYVVDCATLDDAIDAARRLARGRTPGALEIRPLLSYQDFGSVE